METLSARKPGASVVVLQQTIPAHGLYEHIAALNFNFLEKTQNSDDKKPRSVAQARFLVSIFN
jgi:hypothetical protein